MPNDTISVPPTNADDTTLGRLKREYDAAAECQARRHDAWDEIYRFYRNKVSTNRLTQRQAVHLPLMRETIKTLLSRIDDSPKVNWKSEKGDLKAEMILQAMWDYDSRACDFEGTDRLDKKNVLMYGRSFTKLNWTADGFTMDVLDPHDIIVDPLMNPEDVETARFLVHRNIYRSLRDVLADPKYDAGAKRRLAAWVGSGHGKMETGENREAMEEKLERLRSMGADSSDFDRFAAGDVILNLAEHLTQVWDPKLKRFVRRVQVVGDGRELLYDRPLREALGVEFWPVVTWVEDAETVDPWPNALADDVRVPNKVVDVWFSQMVENRTLRNFQMHWFDATNPKYVPQTYEPGPGRMLPAPGNPKDTIMPVDISGLDETLGAIDFVRTIVERSTAATAIEKGQSDSGTQTLGEVELLVNKSMERTMGMAKAYRRAWQERAVKWEAMTRANVTGPVNLLKPSRSGKLWPLKAWPNDWKKAGEFIPTVESSSEQESENIRAIQKMQFVMSQFPNNSALRRISQRRMLSAVDLTLDEMREVEQSEEESQKKALQAVSAPAPAPAPMSPTANRPPLAAVTQ
jgi:hypothetical protein